jgi:hypothetical protein
VECFVVLSNVFLQKERRKERERKDVKEERKKD